MPGNRRTSSIKKETTEQAAVANIKRPTVKGKETHVFNEFSSINKEQSTILRGSQCIASCSPSKWRSSQHKRTLCNNCMAESIRDLFNRRAQAQEELHAVKDREAIWEQLLEVILRKKYTEAKWAHTTVKSFSEWIQKFDMATSYIKKTYTASIKDYCF